MTADEVKAEDPNTSKDADFGDLAYIKLVERYPNHRLTEAAILIFIVGHFLHIVTAEPLGIIRFFKENVGYPLPGMDL